MIPRLSRRRLGLHSRGLNGYVVPNVLFQHGNSVKSSLVFLRPLCFRNPQFPSFFFREAVLVHQPQSFTGSSHAVVLAFELHFAVKSLLVEVALPRAVDCPVSEIAITVQVNVRDSW